MASLECGQSNIGAVLELAALDKRDWETTLERILRTDMRLMGVDRVSYWSVYSSPPSIACELGVVNHGAELERGAYLTYAQTGSYLDEIGRADIINIEDTARDPRARDLQSYCRARDISSLLDVPVLVDSQLVGLLCHEHVGPARHWSDGDVSFVLSAAQMVASALEARRRSTAEEQQRRAHFLAGASLQLAQSLDEDRVLRCAVSAALPALGDWAALDLFEAGSVTRAAVAHVDPARQALLAEYARRFPPRPGPPHLSAQVRALKQAVVYPEVSDEALRLAGCSEAQARLLRQLGMRSLMAVPLVVAESLDAVLLLASAERSRDAAWLELASEYGLRVASTLCNARLYRKAHEALRARDDFMTLAAHELRTPLTSLRVACERMTGLAEPLSPDLTTLAHRILRQSRRLSTLVNRMLDVSQGARGLTAMTTVRVDLVSLVREVVDEFASLPRHGAVELELPDPLLGDWDPDRVQEVVRNLLDNAIKYGAGKPVRLTLEAEGDVAVLTVADQGIGIEEQMLPRLFERYARAVSSRGYGGLGLGLFVVRQIVEAHGGTFAVSSALGSGSRFVVRLPGVVATR